MTQTPVWRQSDAPHYRSKLQAAGQYTAAARLYLKAAEINPTDWVPRYNAGVALARMGRAPEAMEQYRLGLNVDPKECNLNNNLANAMLREEVGVLTRP